VGLQTIVEGDLAFNPVNGLLYGIQDLGITGTQRNLFQINPTTGAGTVIGDVGSQNNTTDFSGLAFSPNGTLYAFDTGAGGGNARLMTIDTANAQIINTVTTNVNFGAAAGLTIHPFTGQAYLADNVSSGGTNAVYTLDLSTGIATMIGTTGDLYGLSGLAFIPVPEPSSFLLAGFAGLLVCRRVRRMCKVK